MPSSGSGKLDDPENHIASIFSLLPGSVDFFLRSHSTLKMEAMKILLS
jgi:hypothetical protein